ncbi:helix-turn-helix domain-containing protein [Oceanicoccus sagamiensis]|uniref:HTH araC/xylS-type domain-containing protein n=1 Tax=Oceanicoccus sagamiensis TaxID=716816 RepID=A0A1X9N9S6_9GAMM|nr:helix-turn-helix domain-containing protein [Oceanicoccus sagamiensis]ARN73182.1 hypothetical protein BST96_03120 [Oceanicoccus sagamiensis]
MQNQFSFLDASFDQFEQLAEVVKDWDLEFHQLSATTTRPSLSQLATLESVINHVHVGCIFDQHGHTPAGFRTFAILETDSPAISFRNQTADPNSLMIFPQDNEIAAASPASFNVYSLSIKTGFLQHQIANLTGLAPEDLLAKEGGVFTGSPESIQALRIFIRNTIKQAKLLAGKPALLAQLLTMLDFDHQFANHIIDCLLNCKQPAAGHSSHKIQQAINQSIDIIQQENHDPIPVKDLAKRVAISQSSLEHGFKKHFGVNPKQYLKYTQLNLVRNALLSANSKTTKVTDIANLYGFWHMGQFASDYKNLFGELPKQTLKSP